MGSFLLLIVAMVVVACSHQEQWLASQIRTDSQPFNSTRLTYRSHNRLSGIDLQYMKESQDLHLEVHGMPITAPYLKVTIDKQEEQHAIKLHQGGQRIALPKELQKQLIEALRAQKEITLQLEGYQEEIIGRDLCAKLLN